MRIARDVQPEWESIADAARRAGVTEGRIRQAIEDGQISALRIGRLWRVNIEDVKNLTPTATVRFRIDPELWEEAKSVAAARNDHLQSVIQEAIFKYVDENYELVDEAIYEDAPSKSHLVALPPLSE